MSVYREGESYPSRWSNGDIFINSNGQKQTFKNGNWVKNGDYMESFKNYIEKHRDIFFTIGIVLLLDHFVFGGAFTDKLKKIIDNMLDSKTKALENGK